MPDNVTPQGNAPTTQQEADQNRLKRFKIGAAEIYAVWPLLIFALVLVGMVYGIILYESLFRLPLLAPVK